MADSGGNPFFDPFNLMRFAPQTLTQDILRGWSLISITENNSSAPDTEKRIVEQESYGRQIGKLTDAVLCLIDDLPDDKRDAQAYVELAALKDRIDKLKAESATKRLNRWQDDLSLLKASDPAEYSRQIERLKAYLA
ncbi:hypothetical protein PQU92_16015 [Asticcacaulis sp. BYS171W]|uniref:Uncharacterized protein n=1 Tax=Asticcacaulis aquaticus TaxID=2984212 RepID=A0ABT5HXJ5_9CAUL|nr:hypothetical protein [Asticcacaulis aquaticus]MDC7684790.1 hypothetical protein [Asticcacaulis aquaticus]